MFSIGSITHMDELVLGVVLLGAALPVAVGLINGLGLLFALVFIQILTQVQDPSTVVLQKKEDGTLSEDVCKPLKSTNDWNKKHLFTSICGQYVKEAFSAVLHLSYLIGFFILMSCCLISLRDITSCH